MPPQKIIIRSRSSKSKVMTPKQELNETQSKVLERLLSSKSKKELCEEQKNQQYFDHLGGQCICVLCNCGKHHCDGKFCRTKPQMHGKKTIYQREFVHKSPDINTHYNQNLFQNPKQEGDIGNVTTYKHDFPGYFSNLKGRSNQPQSVHVSGPFSGTSTYTNMFRNWGTSDAAELLPQNNPTVIKDLPFYGRSYYRDSYQGLICEPAKSTKDSKFSRSPLSPPNMKFNGVSIAKSSYQPFRTEKQTNNKNQKLIQINPSYQGQYNSEYFKEYDQKSLQTCPAKEVLDEVSKQV